MLNLQEIKTQDILPIARNRIAEHAPRHPELDYAELFSICRRRALTLWNTKIAPELDIEAQRAFERALANVGMRAGLSIPWSFASGYAFGVACHAASGGNPAQRNEAATACGLLMFFMGTYDHLLDEHPEEFEGIDSVISAQSIRKWATGEALDQLRTADSKILANGLLRLYQVYFTLCSRMIAGHTDTALNQIWLQALNDIHRVEAESVDRRISKSPPSEALIHCAEEPSIVAFWALALTACLGETENQARATEQFAKGFGRLTWFVDDFSDIEKDIHDDRWSGLAIRLAMGARDKQSTEQIVLELSDAAGELIADLYKTAGNLYWEEGDKFSIADLLWAYIWAWLGGKIQVAKPLAELTT